MPAPLDPAKRRAIEQDIRDGQLSCTAIAKTHAVSRSTVSKIGRELTDNGDLDTPAFERSQTEKATRARQADLAARRAELAEALLEDARRLREQLWAPCTWGNFGGKENTYNEVTLERPRFGDQSSILGAVEKAVRTSTALTADGDAVDKAATLLERLAE